MPKRRAALLWAARFITLVLTLLLRIKGHSTWQTSHTHSNRSVFMQFLPATGFLTKNDVKTAHLNKQMQTSIFSNCLTCSGHIDTTEMKSLISKYCFISLRVKSNTKQNFFTKEKNVNYGLKLIKFQYWFTNFKKSTSGIPWWFSDWDSTLSLLWVQVQPPVWELRSCKPGVAIINTRC